MKRRFFLSALLAAPAIVAAAPALARQKADVEPPKSPSYAPYTDFSGAHTHTLSLPQPPVHNHSCHLAYGSFDGGRTHVWLDPTGFKVA